MSRSRSTESKPVRRRSKGLARIETRARRPALVGVAARAVTLVFVLVGSSAGPAAHAAAPAHRYVISGGTVYDTRTKLTWQRAVPETTYAWPDAQSLCSSGDVTSLGGSGWRLPTKKELMTLVDYTVAPPGPTIDVTAFPDTPAGSYWSASPLAASVPGRWFVDFAHGYAADYAEGPTSYVRCVR